MYLMMVNTICSELHGIQWYRVLHNTIELQHQSTRTHDNRTEVMLYPTAIHLHRAAAQYSIVHGHRIHYAYYSTTCNSTSAWCMVYMPRVGAVVVLCMIHVVQHRCMSCAMPSRGAIYGAKE